MTEDTPTDIKQQLVLATIDILVEEGVKHVSVRRVASRVDMTLGAVSYYFKKKDDLLLSAFEHCIRSDSERLARQLEAVAPLPVDHSLMAVMIENELIGTDTASRRLLQVWAELQMLCSTHQHNYIECLQRWIGLRRQYWQDLATLWRGTCQANGIGERLTHFWMGEYYFFLAASSSKPDLTLVYRKKIDTLLTLIQHPGSLDDRRHPNQDALYYAIASRAQQLLDHQKTDQQRPKGYIAILDAALTTVSQEGPEALTHRRIAKAAGVSLAATTYHFKTLSDLIEGMIFHVQQRYSKTSLFEPVSGVTKLQQQFDADWQLYRDGRLITLLTGLTSSAILGTRFNTFHPTLHALAALRGVTLYQKCRTATDPGFSISLIAAATVSSIIDGMRTDHALRPGGLKTDRFMAQYQQVFEGLLVRTSNER